MCLCLARARRRLGRRGLLLVLVSPPLLLLLLVTLDLLPPPALPPPAAAAPAAPGAAALCVGNGAVRACLAAGDPRRWGFVENLRLEEPPAADGEDGEAAPAPAGAWALGDAPLFVAELAGGRVLTALDCRVLAAGEEPEEGEAAGLGAARVATVRVALWCPGVALRVDWAASASRGSAYLRVALGWRAAEPLALTKMLALHTASAETAAVVGAVGEGFGAVLFHRQKLLYVAAEHPKGATGRLAADAAAPVVAGLVHVPPVLAVAASENLRAPLLRPLHTGDSVVHMAAGAIPPDLSVVVGAVARASNLRRAITREYLARVRARPAVPFLHYNSWFDFATWQEPNATNLFADRHMTEVSCVARISALGEALVKTRGVQLDTFLFDDGWDDHSTLWQFHPAFPAGFANVAARAQSFGSGIGVWLSPWGGYGAAREARLTYGRTAGFEIGAHGFLLSGRRYFQRLQETALGMVQRHGVSAFKFDGIGFSGTPTTLATELRALLRLCNELRAAAAPQGLFLSLTTGTWPSIFWLRHGDAVWRGLGDLGCEGAGSPRQCWVTYRDAVVYWRVVRAAPLFPIHALMLHGIVVGAVGQSRALKLDEVAPEDDLRDFGDEVWTFFGSGVVLQELYISPDRMNEAAWDVLAAGARWARLFSSVLDDSHWIGGDPVAAEPYGFAALAANFSLGVLTLRNPGPTPASLILTLASAWELDEEENSKFLLVCRYQRAMAPQSSLSLDCPPSWSATIENCRVSPGTSGSGCLAGAADELKFTLGGLDVVVLEGYRQY